MNESKQALKKETEVMDNQEQEQTSGDQKMSDQQRNTLTSEEKLLEELEEAFKEIDEVIEKYEPIATFVFFILRAMQLSLEALLVLWQSMSGNDENDPNFEVSKALCRVVKKIIIDRYKREYEATLLEPLSKDSLRYPMLQKIVQITDISENELES